MYIGPRPRKQRKKPTPEQLHAAAIERSRRLLAQIRHWLTALETFHNLKNAPRRAFTPTMCTGDGGTHWTHVRLMPSSTNARSLSCAAPRDRYPDAVLFEEVITPLRQAGFTVSPPTNRRCGCAVFTVHPRKLAGA